MKIWLTRLFLTNKRLFRTYSFLVLLLMIPLTAVSLSFISTADKGVVTIAVSAKDGEESSQKGTDPAVGDVLKRLKEHTSIIRFLEKQSAEEAIRAAARGQADAAWVFSPDYNAALALSAEGRPQIIAEVYTKEDTVFMRLAREKLFAAVYPDLSRRIFRSFIAGTMGEIPDDDFLKYYSLEASEKSLVRFSFTDSVFQPEAAVRGDYLLFPVRGLLSVLIFAAGIAAAVFYAQDEKNGCFTWLSGTGKHSMLLCYTGSAVFWTGAFSLLALKLTGTSVSALYELLLMLLYGVSVTALCGILLKILRKAEYLTILLPAAILLILALCPVFLNFRTFRVFSRLLPAFHYLHAVGSAGYARSLLLTAVGYAFADLAAAWLLSKLHILSGRKI